MAPDTFITKPELLHELSPLGRDEDLMVQETWALISALPVRKTLDHLMPQFLHL